MILNNLIEHLTVISVVILNKIFKFNVYRMNSDRIGHLALNNDLFLKRVNNGFFGKNDKFILIGPGEKGSKMIANKTLYKIISEKIKQTSSIIFIENFILFRMLNMASKKLANNGININLEMNSNEVEFSIYKPIFFFDKNTVRDGIKKLQNLGFYNGKKIVCVYARDSTFLFGDKFSYHDYRNADIDTYIPSIKYLINLDYFVVRIGSIAAKRVSYNNPNFLDYPFSKLKSDFFDTFFIYISDFVIGTTSGITDVATVFGIPFLGVNYAPFTECPLGKYDLFIQKKLIDRSGKVIEYKKIIDGDLKHVYKGDEFYKRTGLTYLDNTSEEILKATKEMQSIVSGDLECSGNSNLSIEYFSNYWPMNKRGGVATPLCEFWLKENKNLYL